MLRRWRRRATVVLCVFAAFIALVTAPAVGVVESKALLDMLSGMSSKQAVSYLVHHHEVVIQLADSDPKLVAGWWHSVSQTERKVIVREVPDVIGNLDGVDYGSRDAANRKQLARSIANTRHVLHRHPHDGRARTLQHALIAIRASVTGHRAPHRFLASFSADRPPLAAVAVGNLDTAKQVTFNVPGMGTYSDDMQLWTQSALNVYRAQGKVDAPPKRAVVAWIGYVTPPPGIDATTGDYAARGAPRLVADIEGLQAVHHEDSEPSVSIVAHSYGTTTAADALNESHLGIYAFVMFGSAGIEYAIPNAAALHVKHVYAGEAADDEEAMFGRFSRADPLSPSFGARPIGVDGDLTSGLLPVTGHDPVLHSPWNDDPFSTAWSGIKSTSALITRYENHFKTYGYLDSGTEALQNAAIATTPHATRRLTGTH